MKKVIVMNEKEKQMNDLISRWNKTPEEIAKDIRALSAEQPEVIEEVIKEYCRDRCLCLVDNMLLKKYTFAQPEPIRINLNEWIKVKLTDWGKEIYYHQYDRINQIAGKKICEPKFPKEDENGYTKFQLWCFIELYGEHMGITLPNVIEPLEIVYER